MTRLEIDDTLHLIPNKWNELTKQDLLEFCRIQFLDTSEDYKKFLMLQHFTKLPFKKIEAIPGNSLPCVVSIVNYLFGESWLTINLIGDVVGLKSPDPALTNFTFEQFLGQSEPYLYSISKGNSYDIDNLINTLYNYNGPDENKEKLKEISEAEKLGIILFYQGCSNFIKKRFPAVFTKSETKSKPDGLEFARLVNSLNLGDVSKNKNIKQNNLYESLEFLTQLINKNHGS